MKKLSLMIIFAVLCLAILAGCKNNQNPPDGSQAFVRRMENGKTGKLYRGGAKRTHLRLR